MTLSKSARIHDQLNHPVVDGDGHNLEYMPLLLEYVREFGGAKAVDFFTKRPEWCALDRPTRLDKRLTRPPWWTYPTRLTLDHATSLLPALLEERLGEMGIDFTILYPTRGIRATDIQDADIRAAACRALNVYQSEIFAPHAARMTPAAAIPMHTPTEAIEELDYAVGKLRMKAVMMAGHVRRPLPGVDSGHPLASWIDNLAIDSQHDYDPVWRRCTELGVAPTFHSGSSGWGSRVSVNNYVYNHIGHFAAASEATCKALFMGGVTFRFPELRFLFLESGAAWAVNVFSDLIGHWQKRNAKNITTFDPENVDLATLSGLFTKYASPALAAKASDVTLAQRQLGYDVEDLGHLDDFEAAGITSVSDIAARFVPSFFFGCEADDRMNALAFDPRLNPFGAKLSAVFSSDIGHWDVPDMREVLEEAWELVEDELLSMADFKDFVFTNPVRVHTSMNPSFFAGTAVEKAVTDSILTGLPAVPNDSPSVR